MYKRYSKRSKKSRNLAIFLIFKYSEYIVAVFIVIFVKVIFSNNVFSLFSFWLLKHIMTFVFLTSISIVDAGKFPCCFKFVRMEFGSALLINEAVETKTIYDKQYGGIHILNIKMFLQRKQIHSFIVHTTYYQHN